MAGPAVNVHGSTGLVHGSIIGVAVTSLNSLGNRKGFPHVISMLLLAQASHTYTAG